MIITHTSNPSLDYYMELPRELTDGIQRACSAYCLAGGKGLNVSLILDRMGIPSVATAFLGGFTGREIRSRMEAYPNIRLDIVEVDEPNRINVKIRGDKETDINAPGPMVDKAHQQLLLDKLECLREDDWLLICGSLARGMKADFLEEAAEVTRRRGARLVLDISGIKADVIARCRPALIKPNVEELCGMFDMPAEEDAPVEEMADRLLEMGVECILLSNGSRGANLYTKDRCWQVRHPALQAVSTVGSGDSMLAAFVGKMAQGEQVEEALAWAAAAGAATAVSPGLAEYGKIEQLREIVCVTEFERKGGRV